MIMIIASKLFFFLHFAELFPTTARFFSHQLGFCRLNDAPSCALVATFIWINGTRKEFFQSNTLSMKSNDWVCNAWSYLDIVQWTM